jgi:hypothetical protein
MRPLTDQQILALRHAASSDAGQVPVVADHRATWAVRRATVVALHHRGLMEAVERMHYGGEGRPRVTVRAGRITPEGLAALVEHDRELAYAEARDRDHAEALASLEQGAVVIYRGSKIDEHCFEYVVIGRGAPRGEGYILACREYPGYTLSQVRRSSFYPTGEQLALCAHCQHSQEQASGRAPHLCEVTTCRCDQHAPTAVSAS